MLSFFFYFLLLCLKYLFSVNVESQLWDVPLKLVSYLVKGKVTLKALDCRTCSVLQKPKIVISKCFSWNFQANHHLGAGNAPRCHKTEVVKFHVRG